MDKKQVNPAGSAGKWSAPKKQVATRSQHFCPLHSNSSGCKTISGETSGQNKLHSYPSDITLAFKQVDQEFEQEVKDLTNSAAIHHLEIAAVLKKLNIMDEITQGTQEYEDTRSQLALLHEGSSPQIRNQFNREEHVAEPDVEKLGGNLEKLETDLKKMITALGSATTRLSAATANLAHYAGNEGSSSIEGGNGEGYDSHDDEASANNGKKE